MAIDPRSPEFWDAENAHLWGAVSPLAMEILLGGVDGGLALLPPEVAILMNWDVFNQFAIDFLRHYKLDIVDGISDTTRKQVIQHIEEWIQSGEPLIALEKRLLPVFGNPRARRIAVTEITRIYDSGNQAAWQATGVVSAKQWFSVRDDRVTPICRALDGQVADINGSFVVPAGAIAGDAELAKMVSQFGDTFSGPPAHVNCRSYTQPIVSVEAFRRQLERELGLI
jgi:SPP1 gp7 family putative phage head morphogenesis protein